MVEFSPSIGSSSPTNSLSVASVSFKNMSSVISVLLLVNSKDGIIEAVGTGLTDGMLLRVGAALVVGAALGAALVEGAGEIVGGGAKKKSRAGAAFPP